MKKESKINGDNVCLPALFSEIRLPLSIYRLPLSIKSFLFIFEILEVKAV